MYPRLLVLVLSAMWPAVVFAQAPLFLRASDVSVEIGDEFWVALQVGTDSQPMNNVYFVGAQIHFDASQFELVSAPRGSLFANRFDGLNDPLEVRRFVQPSDDLDTDGSADGQSYYAYSVSLVGTDATPAAAPATVLMLGFRVRSGASSGLAGFRLTEARAAAPPDDQGNPTPIVVRPQGADVVVGNPSGVAIARTNVSPPSGAQKAVVPLPAGFDEVELGFVSLSSTAEVTAIRDASTPSGTALPSNLSFVTDGVWQFDQIGADSFEAEVCFSFDLLIPEAQRVPNEVLIYRRADNASPWTALSTHLQPSAATPEQVCATVTSFSTFALAAPTAALPVELVGFSAVLDGARARLVWETASETDNAGFWVEQRWGGASAWQVLGWVEGAGTTLERQHYAFDTVELPPGAHYFRLRQVDLDGATEIGAEIVVTVPGASALSLAPFAPQPMRGTAQALLSVEEAGWVRVEVYDPMGRRVARLFEGNLEPGRAEVLSLSSQWLAPGVYTIVAASKRAQVLQRAVVLR